MDTAGPSDRLHPLGGDGRAGLSNNDRRRADLQGIAGQVSCSSTHCVALTSDGAVLTWATSSAGNRFGQLCRSASPPSSSPTGASQPRQVDVPTDAAIVAVGAGGGPDAGHTALVGDDGSLWVCGCDRWQQLGLSGAAAAGNSAGYTWQEGRIWQAPPQRVPFFTGRDASTSAASVACGADHTVALSRNGQDVYTWGRGEHGQLGLTPGGARRGPFLSAPRKSAALSVSPLTGDGLVLQLYAEGNCSLATHTHGAHHQANGHGKAELSFHRGGSPQGDVLRS